MKRIIKCGTAFLLALVLCLCLLPTFGEPYATPEHAARPVTYASRQELFLRIDRAYGKKGTQPTQTQQAPVAERRSPYSAMGLYNEDAKT